MSAQRASGPARFAGFVAAAALVVVAAVLAVRLAGRRETPPAGLPRPPARRTASVDRKEQVRHEEYKDGKLAAAVRGDAFFLGPDGRDHLRGAVEVSPVRARRRDRLAAHGRRGRLRQGRAPFRHLRPGPCRGRRRHPRRRSRSSTTRPQGPSGRRPAGGSLRKRCRGEAQEVCYAEGPDEVRLGGGFKAGTAAEDGSGGGLVLSGDSFVFDRRGRRGRADGRAALEGRGLRGLGGDRSVRRVRGRVVPRVRRPRACRGGALPWERDAGRGKRGGPRRADRSLVRPRPVRPRGDPGLGPLPPLSPVRAGPDGGRSRAEDPPELRPRARPLDLVRLGRRPGGARGGRPARPRRSKGTRPCSTAAGVLGIHGRSGRPAVADSDEARIEAPKILVASDGGRVLATGGVACVLKKEEGRRAVGFFSPRQDVAVSSDALEISPGVSKSLFTGRVLVSQGTDTLRADEIELVGDTGEMRGRGGVRAVRTAAASGAFPRPPDRARRRGHVLRPRPADPDPRRPGLCACSRKRGSRPGRSRPSSAVRAGTSSRSRPGGRSSSPRAAMRAGGKPLPTGPRPAGWSSPGSPS